MLCLAVGSTASTFETAEREKGNLIGLQAAGFWYLLPATSEQCGFEAGALPVVRGLQ